MTHQNLVSVNQMKEALAKHVGSKFPVKITLTSGEIMIRYVRGFADHQTNILLISDNAYSLAVKILEVKEIDTLEFAEESAENQWRTLRAKWHSNRARGFKVL